MAMTNHKQPQTQQTITSIKQMLLIMEQQLTEREAAAAGQRERNRRQLEETLTEMRLMMKTIQERLDEQNAQLAALVQAIAALYAAVTTQLQADDRCAVGGDGTTWPTT